VGKAAQLRGGPARRRNRKEGKLCVNARGVVKTGKRAVGLCKAPLKKKEERKEIGGGGGN